MKSYFTSAYRAARRDGYTASHAFEVASRRVEIFQRAQVERDAAWAAMAKTSHLRRYDDARREAVSFHKAASRAWEAAYNAAHGPDSLYTRRPVRCGHDIGTDKSCFMEDPPFRFVGTPATIGITDHTGWHLDPHGDGETCEGVVYRDTRGNCYAGYADPFNADPKTRHGPALLFLTPYDDAGDAAYVADKLAESYAEKEREYQEAREAGVNAYRTRKEQREAIALLVKRVRSLRYGLAAAKAWGAPLAHAQRLVDEATEALCDALGNRTQPGPEWRFNTYLDGYWDGYRHGWQN